MSQSRNVALRNGAVIALGFGLTLAAPAAMGQTASCQCDCYFSFDCPGGVWCNYGSLFVEDSCFWRLPKPQGVPGAGCNDNYGDWGQCDGICTGVTDRSFFSGEAVGMLKDGVALWGRAFTEPALRGGGAPEARLTSQVRALRFGDTRVADGLGKIVGEIMMITRGQDFLDFPEKEAFVFGEANVADLRGDAARVAAGDLAVEALLAEIDAVGSGAEIVARIPLASLDSAILERICEGSTDRRDCVHRRIADMGELLARGGRNGKDGDGEGAGGLRGTTFPPCAVKGDFDNDGDVDDWDYRFFARCLYGPDVNPPADPGDTEEDVECILLFDFDGDSDIDLSDFKGFIESYVS